MDQVTGTSARPTIGRALGCVAAVLLFGAALLPAGVAKAAQGGGAGGFHGGGFHGGGFHGGGFHGGGFHGGGFHDGFNRGFAGRRGGFAIGLGSIYAPYPWGYPYPYYVDPDYGYQPNASQYWYYCSDPAGYYPYVTQCNTGWQPVPAG